MTLSELLARVEAATAGYDPDLSAAISLALDYSGHGAFQLVNSVDAALSLIEAKLPGACWRVEKHTGQPVSIPPFWATAGLAGEGEQAYANSAPLALLAAFLTYLQGVATTAAADGDGRGRKAEEPTESKD